MNKHDSAEFTREEKIQILRDSIKDIHRQIKALALKLQVQKEKLMREIFGDVEEKYHAYAEQDDIYDYDQDYLN